MVGRLTREDIVSAALELVDGAGLQALTARRLAERLEVKPASLYHHVGGMEDLLVEVAWRVVSVMKDVPVEESWQRMAWARASRFREALLDHPNVIPVLSGPLGKKVLRERFHAEFAAHFERFVSLLAADGITKEDALTVIEAVEAYSIGAATVASPNLTGAGAGEVPVGPRFANLLSRHDRDADRRFETGMLALLDGLALRCH